MLKPQSPPRRPKVPDGFSMVELLMAMFIFAIGLLGLMSLQAATLRQSGTSRLRGTASFVAHTVLDRILAEGLESSAERYTPPHVVITDATRVFIGSNADASAGASGADVYFDINGQPLPTTTAATDPAILFRVAWVRAAGEINLSSHTGLQEFVVNVTWRESDATAGPGYSTKSLSVSRYVRI